MKKVIKKSLVLAVMFTALVGYANEIVYTDKEKDEITNVTFKNVSEGSVLTIKDLNGLILYKETMIKQAIYSKGFDLTALPDGDYLFELDEESEIKVIPFKVTLNKVIFNKEIETIIIKPSIIEKNGIVKIHKSMLNNKPLIVNIYHENGDLVFTEKFKDEQVFNKTFDFSTSIKGEYRIEVSNDDRTFVKDVKI